MKILIICPCWPGLEEAYNEGVEPNGMPGFYYVLKEMIKQGHEIHLCIYTPREVFFGENCMSKTHWFSNVKIVQLIKLKQFRKLLRVLYELYIPSIICKELKKLVEDNQYDFIYGQGNVSDCARIIAYKYKIPFGLRKFGDDFSPLVKKNGLLIASLRSPLSALSYITKKDFILATNDGTEIDKLARRFAKRNPYDLYLWNNGFDDSVIEDSKFKNLTYKPFIFYCSRVTSEKGLIDAIEILKKCVCDGFDGNLLVAGSIDDLEYYKKVQKKVDEYKLGSNYYYLGKISAGQIKYLTETSIGNVICGLNNNLNNVLIETLGYGGIALVRKTTLIDTIIDNTNNGFVYNDNTECSKIIIGLYNNTYNSKKIREQAMNTCKSTFGSWEKRVNREIELILSYIPDGKE